MTTPNEVKQAVNAKLLAGLPSVEQALGLPVPYTFDNESVDPPGGEDGSGSPWVRCVVRNRTGQQTTMGNIGNRKFTRTAAVFIQVYVPPDTGTAQCDLVVQRLRDLYEGCPFPGTTIRMWGADCRELGLVEDGRWWASTIEVPFDYEEVK